VTGGGNFGVTLSSGNIKVVAIQDAVNAPAAVSLQTNGAASTITLGTNLSSSTFPVANSISVLAGSGQIPIWNSCFTVTPELLGNNGGSVYLSAYNLEQAKITIDVSAPLERRNCVLREHSHCGVHTDIEQPGSKH